VTDSAFWIGFLQIIGIDLLLSGDNAVVIALACRNLPSTQRRRAMIAGSGAAVALRVAFAFVIFELLSIPYLRLAGGLLLLWVGIRLGRPQGDKGEGDDGENPGSAEQASIWRTIGMIAAADAIMSLDNVVAIAGAAKGSPLLLGLGLVMSVPLVISGSSLTLRLIDRFPVIVVLGAGLVGWIAGDMIAAEPIVQQIAEQAPWLHYAIPLLGIGIAAAGSRLSAGRPITSRH